MEQDKENGHGWIRDPGSRSRRNFDTEADLFKKCTVPDQDSGKKDSIPGKS